MPKSMFQDVVCPREDSTRKWYTLPVSFVVHTAVLVVLIVVPLVAVDVLPTPRSMLAFVTPPQVPLAVAVAPQRLVSTKPILAGNPDAAPVDAPRGISPESGVIRELEPASLGTAGTLEGLAGAAVMDAPPPPSPPAPVKPVRPGGVITAPMRVKDVPPVYPPIAQSARVQGDVIIEATIGPDGKVQDARVLRSVPLLDQAAVTAVRSWEYTPTLLNGQPVPVIMTVTVRFRLQ